MTLPSVLIASPIRYRPDCPEVLPAFLESIKGLRYRGDVSMHLVIHQAHDRYDGFGLDPVTRVLSAVAMSPQDVDAWSIECCNLRASPDSRHLGGPRTTGETQENLAYLRNRILRKFQESKADLLLMVDSDVILAPNALDEMVSSYESIDARNTWRPHPVGCTITLQIDNRVVEDGASVSNAQVLEQSTDGIVLGVWVPVPFSMQRTFREIDRGGACTLYPREVLTRRFRWDPRYNEEHQAFFDDLREIGFRHWFLQDPSLVEHRMKREPSRSEAIRRAKAEMEAKGGA